MHKISHVGHAGDVAYLYTGLSVDTVREFMTMNIKPRVHVISFIKHTHKF